MIAVVYSITFVDIMPFIRIYTSGIEDNNYDLPVFGFLFVLSAMIYMISVPQGMLVTASGNYRVTQKQVTIQCSILLSVSVVAIPVFGIYGVLMGSICSAVNLCVACFSFVPKHISFNEVSRSVYGVMRCFLSVVLTCVPFLFLDYEPETFLTWILFVVVVAVYALFVVAVLHLSFSRDEVYLLWIRVKNMVKKEG